MMSKDWNSEPQVSTFRLSGPPPTLLSHSPFYPPPSWQQVCPSISLTGLIIITKRQENGRGEDRVGVGLEMGAYTEKLIRKFASSLLPAGSLRESQRSRPFGGAVGSAADFPPG